MLLTSCDQDGSRIPGTTSRIRPSASSLSARTSNLPSTVSDESLGMAFMTCAPFRPKIARDNNVPMLSETIEFKFLEEALATLQSRPLPGVPSAHLMLLPYPPTNPPTGPLLSPSALPRLVKHLPINFGDSALFDLFRPFGTLASVRIPTHFGVDTSMIEFWNEDDARCATQFIDFSGGCHARHERHHLGGSKQAIV
ncbi:hypothetical protein F5880DRAFT_1631741 [Lentinula raphanica]|nr:hypothetical protein F5880DRAFT_1631741 [Lentinula raphanica]